VTFFCHALVFSDAARPCTDSSVEITSSLLNT
jgi:hypothetical protein